MMSMMMSKEQKQELKDSNLHTLNLYFAYDFKSYGYLN